TKTRSATPKTKQEPRNSMSHQQQQHQYQNYIPIEEDVVAEPSIPRIVHLRNVASPRAAPLDPERSIRAQMLEALMPLSRNPWGSLPTAIENNPQGPPKNRHTTTASSSLFNSK
ncbi:hypothetical protein BG011_007951, partial [Mortierella polycephala]